MSEAQIEYKAYEGDVNDLNELNNYLERVNLLINMIKQKWGL